MPDVAPMIITFFIFIFYRPVQKYPVRIKKVLIEIKISESVQIFFSYALLKPTIYKKGISDFVFCFHDN